ncbi:MAG: flagellar biosynthetic protein FliP [Gammaproteobacteria bacterium]|nr:flagellar type III secretion system pore protein FliP [Gammaproteobacteria bacterium]PCH62709.1 MAG: flagellar biosynthetic protein FliP [Gammaproteobacteria bacterium]PCH64154.1 MAG: flagellar biosynthetic protein FliP [Gammaproteobacteria bacterium]
MRTLVALLLVLFPFVSSVAAPGLDAISVTTAANGDETYSVSLQILLLMTLLSLLPAALLMMTSFTRIIIVLALLRTAMGTAQTPTTQVLIGVALFLTFFIMAPVFEQVYDDAVTPYLAEEMSVPDALQAASKPFRNFMMEQVRDSDLQLFSDLSGNQEFDSLDDIPMSLLMPAFVTSEIKTGFQIGFLVFIPFLVIDLVVASALMSMGMVFLSPIIISLPFKIMLFVLVDGWVLLVGTLASSFYV